MKRIMTYVPSAVVPYAATNDERWASELRRVTVLFVNLGLSEVKVDLDTNVTSH
jgi:hypothetical protein